MQSFWMPKKQPLYAPMLSTFGGGSARGFRALSGDPAKPWEGLQTGDTYQGGTIQNNGSSMGVYWYVTPRTINTLTTFPSSLTTTFTVEGQSAIRVWLVGGGAGSNGSNGPAGGGGGAINSSGDIAVSEGSQYNIKVGHGGCLGFNGVNSDLNPAYFPNSNYAPTAGGESRMWPVSGTGVTHIFDVTAYGGGAPAQASNTSTPSDLGQGGGSNISNNGGLSWVQGTGGRGGGRNFVATGGTNGGAGGGGGQQDVYTNVKGGDGSGLWGGSGGAGNHYESNSSNTNSGYPANTTTGSYAYPGGSGGSVYASDTSQGGNGTPIHGQNGSGPGGGYAVSSTSERQTWYYQNTISGPHRGSAGGGGFPGGAGGSAVWGGSPSNGGAGFGADGASGIVYIQWAI